jgi:hypothetical protein
MRRGVFFLITMKKIAAGLVLFLTMASMLPAQAGAFHYFDPQKPFTIQGTVQALDYEDVYGKRSKFLVLTILSDDRRLFRVEICPQWFFHNDIAAGMKIHIQGSLLDSDEETPYLIARELSFQGERIVLRDRRGFPLWGRKGSQGGRASRKGSGGRGKG